MFTISVCVSQNAKLISPAHLKSPSDSRKGKQIRSNCDAAYLLLINFYSKICFLNIYWTV